MLVRSLLEPVLSNPASRSRLKRVLTEVGYDTTHWVRVIMYERCFAFIRSVGPETLDALEISAGPQWRREFKFRSYTATQYPDFDICSQTLERKFDLIIADQVFEHLPWPYRAGKNVYSMLRPGGHFVIATPFLLKVHKVPLDCSRWTEQGLSYLLQECGFAAADIKTDSWGNRTCVRANFTRWRTRGWFRSLANEPDFPVMVWALAQKSRDARM
jgi:SAM-dependent methyltransferase